MSTRSVPEGQDLLRFVAELEVPSDCWVQAVGHVEGAELAVPEGEAERSVVISGRAALVSLGGTRGGALFALVSVATQGETRLIGGRLVRARSAGVTLATSVEEDAAPDTTRDSGRAGPPSPSLEEDEESGEAPAYGDRVDHFVFGLCDVMVVHGERVKIRDLGASGKLRELLLRAVRVQRPVMRDGKRVFKLLRRS